jgi:hypothetical protein
MAPQAGRYMDEQENDRGTKEVYAEFVVRIDRFLECEAGEVRRGTQTKVRESLKVLNTALQQYKCPSLSLTPKTY